MKDLDLIEVHTTEGVPNGQTTYMGTVFEAHPAAVAEVLALPVEDDNLATSGRSPWFWLRLPNGDLVFGTFVQGADYESLEWDHAAGDERVPFDQLPPHLREGE